MPPGHLDRQPRPAIYAQIADFYRAAIRTGDLSPGDKLPPVTEMQETWGVADMTVRRALAALKKDGLIDTSRKGTFVKSSVSRRNP